MLIVGLSLVAICLVGYTFFINKYYKTDHSDKSKPVVNLDDRYKAIVNVKTREIHIDGVSLDECETELASDIDNTHAYDVKLWPGEHLFDGFYAVMGFNNCNVVNYRTYRTRSQIKLDAGHKYTLGLYLYSAEERRKFYSDEELVEVYEQEVKISGYEQKAYIICYQTN